MQPRKRMFRLMFRLVAQTAASAALMALALLWAAGDATWPQAWDFLGLFVLTSAGFGAWLVRRDPALLAARLSSPWQQGQPWWDRLFLLLLIPLWFAWLALMALDARRWHWSQMPSWLNAVGAVLIVVGFLGVCRVFAENSFAAPVVRLQAERGQRVIDTGPYAIVRHPMYAAALLYVIGMPLLLGSWAGLCAAPLLLIGLAPRAVLEERLLAQQLAGYDDYQARVRYRLIPGIW
jgi:protein-S-isoprenylcysteine O-methyltransferase Ste14